MRTAALACGLWLGIAGLAVGCTSRITSPGPDTAGSATGGGSGGGTGSGGPGVSDDSADAGGSTAAADGSTTAGPGTSTSTTTDRGATETGDSTFSADCGVIDGVVGVELDIVVKVQNPQFNKLLFGSDDLPDWLDLATSAGDVTGIPPEAGQFVFHVTVDDFIHPTATTTCTVDVAAN